MSIRKFTRNLTPELFANYSQIHTRFTPELLANSHQNHPQIIRKLIRDFTP